MRPLVANVCRPGAPMSTPLDLVAGLGQNMALVFALLFVEQQAQPWLARLGITARGLVTGTLFAIIALLGMQVPIHIADGVVIDARVVLVALAGAYGGIPAGITAALLVSGYRLHVGGVGALAGILAILWGAAVGCLLHRHVAAQPQQLGPWHHLALGLATAAGGLACTFALPAAMAAQAFPLYALPVLISYPLGALMLGGLLTLQHRSRADQTALQASRDRLSLATRSAGIGVWDLDVGSGRLVWDDNMYRLYQVPRDGPADTHTYQTWAKAVHPQDLPRAQDELQTALRAGQDFATTFRIVLADGRVRTIKAIAQAFRDRDGRPTRMVGVNEDITERAATEQELARHREHLEELVAARTAALARASDDARLLTQETEGARRVAVAALQEARHLQESYILAKNQAEAANRTKSEFLASMSHEIRTPLNAVLGYAQVLTRDPGLTSAHRRAVEIINRSGEHLLALITDILEMSRIEAGRSTCDAEDFALHTLLTDLHSLFQLRARDKDLTLRLVLAPGLPPYLRSDARKLRQILLNLLSNAVKFTTTGGVEVHASHHAGELVIAVRDSGPGIAEEALSQLFQPFVQLGAGRGRGEGSGLGLAISRGFARTLGGDLQAESRVGNGSTFTVRVPAAVVADGGRLVATRRQVIGLAPGMTSPRILIAEDHPDHLRLLHDLLAGGGLLVRAVSDGAAAVAAYHDWRPHLIWMDLDMPIMHGLAATQAIRALPVPTDAAPPVIIALTAATFAEDRARILAMGCDEVMHKPYREEELFTAMEQRLGIRFTWKDEAPPGSMATGAIGEAMRRGITDLGADQRQALHYAVITGDLVAITTMTQAWPDRATAAAVMTLVDQFALERLATLTTAEATPMTTSDHVDGSDAQPQPAVAMDAGSRDGAS